MRLQAGRRFREGFAQFPHFAATSPPQDDRREMRQLFPANISRFHNFIVHKANGGSLWNTGDLRRVLSVRA